MLYIVRSNLSFTGMFNSPQTCRTRYFYHHLSKHAASKPQPDIRFWCITNEHRPTNYVLRLDFCYGQQLQRPVMIKVQNNTLQTFSLCAKLEQEINHPNPN